MFRKISETFTATHFTILAVTAMLVPGALYGAVSYQNVAITDPGSGKQAYVDGGRRVYVYDQVAGYRNFPGSAVNIAFSLVAAKSGCQNDTYTIPSGKALVITSMTGAHTTSVGSNPIQYVYDSSNCSGKLLAYSNTSQTDADISMDFGNGIAVAAGKTISVISSFDDGYLFLHGYLVPESTVPVKLASTGAADQGRQITAEDVKAKEASKKARH